MPNITGSHTLIGTSANPSTSGVFTQGNPGGAEAAGSHPRTYNHTTFFDLKNVNEYKNNLNNKQGIQPSHYNIETWMKYR